MWNIVTRFMCLGPKGWIDLIWLSILGVVVEIGLRSSTVPRVATIIGVRLYGEPPSRTGQPVTPAERRRRRLVDMMSRHWPFVDPDGLCLRRSLLLGWVFRRRDPLLRIGVANTSGTTSAHAWLELEGGHLGADGVHVAFPPLAPRRRPTRRRRSDA